MANLGTFTIDTQGTYQTLASLTSLTFTSGNRYSLQVQNMAHVREGLEGEGFLIDNTAPFDWIAGDDDLYIKNSFYSCVVNIAGVE